MKFVLLRLRGNSWYDIDMASQGSRFRVGLRAATPEDAGRVALDQWEAAKHPQLWPDQPGHVHGPPLVAP